MKNRLLILALAFTLQACGGEEDKDHHIDYDFSFEVKGQNAEPHLASIGNDNFLEHDINTRFTGNFDENGGNFSSLYNPSRSQYTAVILNSTATSSYLNIKEMWSTKNTYSQGSLPTIVFESEAGLSYQLLSESANGDGDFDIKIVELNRESLDLSVNEYLVHFTGNYSNRNCWEYENKGLNFYRIINWKEGYMRELNKYVASYFSMVYGNVFEIYQPESQHLKEERTTVKTNFTNGGIVFEHKAYHRTQSEDGTTDSCYSEEYADGEIIL